MNEIVNQLDVISGINYVNWAIGFALLLVYTYVFQIAFKKFALVASNRDLFASNFPFYSIAIFLIITTIKSSLALSLGLVGALSIIRFRTAVKEPEQIIYLLGLTAIAISLAAEQFIISSVCVFIFISIAYLRKAKAKKTISLNTDYLLILVNKASDDSIQKLIGDLSTNKSINSLMTYENFDNDKFKLLFKLSFSNPELLASVSKTVKEADIELGSIRMTSANS